MASREVEEKLSRIIDDMANHVRVRRFTFCEVVFATSDDVCWQLVTGYTDNDDYDGCAGDIRVVKWFDGKPAHIVTFPTDYCFEKFTGMALENEFESLKARMFEFFTNEA